MIALILILIIITFTCLLFRNTGRLSQEYWDGPVPTKEQRAINLQGIHNILEDHPRSLLKHDYPGIAKSAEATRRYKVLTERYENGEIDIIDFNLELQEILKLVDVSEDLKPNKK